ncbi:ATP-dependent RecD-like DNA helicase [Kroppenstedtia guangzhouensis]|uniref:ATP-dependent RecD2 DNA helicase n=1 Tax=Kroppenstedtia guangzhouensis TaxID=1274356 RepID=A0ABQ1G6W6_9BACL|nr:ATP-dependent RecD-like DNA helicase [Kroppenstedtia guangzhouensis]GGA37861.1 ATP-dependent RecD-like DNA helicase [Kroppenstedtia guangzhouensis]
MEQQPGLDLFAGEGYLKGSLVQEIFYNEENQYGVFTLRVTESSEPLDKEEVVVVGNMVLPHPDETVVVYGDWKEHPKYGRQYRIRHMKKVLPQTREAVAKYLSSGLFPGVGKKTAEKIVDFLGPDVLEKAAVDPEILKRVPGITESRANTIADGLREHQALEQALVQLYQLGLGPAIALKVVQTYKEATLDIIRQNPYRLIEEVEGIGFRRADEIARKRGLAPDSPERFQAATLFALREASLSRGHVYVTEEQLTREINVLLTPQGKDLFSSSERKKYLERMAQEERIVEDHGKYYLPSLFYAEHGAAIRVRDWLEQKLEPTPARELFEAVGVVEEELKVSYADRQREAMTMAVDSPVMILTGGPGTGKTTVIRGICHLFAKLNECSLDPAHYETSGKPYPIRLAAPTGRAAKRMSEATGLPAMTIHRLLGWKGDFFERDADHPIEGSLLIVDEVSMLDIWLANQLFRAVPRGMQVVLVGDDDQLPSVGPGRVLQDLLQVEAIPRVELTEIYRQEEGSSIIGLAHALKKGEVPDDLTDPMPDRRFFPCNRDQAVDVILQTYQQALYKGYTLFDVQVLAPMYKGAAGVNRINEEIRQAVNPAKPGRKEIRWGESVFRHGDKVLQLMNHPEHPVYNGDMGLITAMDEEAGKDEPVLWVQFDRQEVPYKRSQLNQLSLAYACSVHKAQGSEFAIVIFPVLKAYRRMLKRNLIYTGITRSKSYLILCGEKEALDEGVRQGEREERNSQLADLIQLEW